MLLKTIVVVFFALTNSITDIGSHHHCNCLHLQQLSSSWFTVVVGGGGGDGCQCGHSPVTAVVVVAVVQTWQLSWWLWSSHCHCGCHHVVHVTTNAAAILLLSLLPRMSVEMSVVHWS
jgi:hypothetical protein